MLGRIKYENQWASKKGPEFQCLEDKMRIPMFIKIGPEFECLERSDKNSNVYKGRNRNTVFGRIR